MAPATGDSSRLVSDQAVLLHRRPYRESSLLVDVFSESHGRVHLLAKGARRGRHSLTSVLQPFVPMRIAWTGRGELPTLTMAESANGRLALHGRGILCGFYINELILQLLPLHDPHPRLFGHYLETLSRLDVELTQETTLRLFEVGLLGEIGYGLSLDREVSGREIDPEKYYAYAPEHGPIETECPTPHTIQGTTLIGLRHGQLENHQQLREAKHLLRTVIRHHLNGRELKSRELFKMVKTS